MQTTTQVEFKSGDKVRFNEKSAFKANNQGREPFIVVRGPTKSDPDHISIKDKKGSLFADGGEGLWHRSHFELV